MPETPVKQMDRWFTQTPGKQLLKAEGELLNNLLPRLFGYHLLQLGGPSQSDWYDPCHIPHHIHISSGCPCHFDGPCLVGNLEELPFAPDSIDVALLPHVLEFANNPQQILQEVYNILLPGGHVVILGFQPWSLWGLFRLLKDRKKAPWRGTFYSSFRVRHWLGLAGYSVEDHKTLFFRPPLTSARWLKKLFFIEALGQILWPYLGGVYLVVAKKRVPAMIPIKSKLFTKRIPVSHGVPQPTVR